MVTFQNRLKLIAIMMLVINLAWSEGAFRIVTDPWPPYVYIENDKAVGIDVDIALAVLGNMGIESQIVMLPWKRSLALVKGLEADAILSAAITLERKEFLYFPAEPISIGNTVFFQRKQRGIRANNLADLYGLKLGAMLGYEYCKELDESPLLLAASRVSTLEQSFNMLMNDRIDLLIEVDAVGIYKAKEMGIDAEISVVAGSRYCASENYLALAKKPGHQALAVKFGEELIKFKGTGEYRKILKKYGMNINSCCSPNL